MKNIFVSLSIVLFSFLVFSCTSSSSVQKASASNKSEVNVSKEMEEVLDHESKDRIVEVAEKRMELYCKLIKSVNESPSTGISAPEQPTTASPDLTELDREIGVFCNTQARLNYYQKIWSEIGNRGCK